MRKQSAGGRKTKTGCATCRSFAGPNPRSDAKSRVSLESAPLDATSLNRYFSTKTIFNVDVSCTQEAEQVLQASLTDPYIRHALLCLRTIREDLETMDSPEQQISSYNYGLQQYSKALSGLASNLSSPSPETLKSALLCCQVLISVEQVRGNFSAMGMHIVRGLDIMREYRARPYMVRDVLMPANHNDLPSLDVFIIKMLAAPCKFTEQPTAEFMMMTPPAEASADRKIAPNLRTGVRRIANSVIGFLGNVSLVKSKIGADELLGERKCLLDSLGEWFDDFEAAQAAGEPRSINNCFLTLLYYIVRVVLLGSLDCGGKSEAENEKIQSLTNEINDRLKDFDMRKGIENGRNEAGS
ncbi:transcriptional regulatory protein moc3 [Fusarium flagelliforme]|uniref:Transcriptional regulatory protein moc3 n=1 Tax=Fusarium flagelliforme TaxID=2675880 RepID=A0A395MTC9_9HYPO|nr:transcriptional regulatory protein moc3 [Fusarium flagelliforme]